MAGQKSHHHFVNVTVSGSWWEGTLDEHGIPHTTMRDSAQNGYSIITFDNTDYEINYKGTSLPAD